MYVQNKYSHLLTLHEPFWSPAKYKELPYMCRNIRPLFNFEPAATEDEVRAASLQFVRKISGFTKPSQANETAFYAAVDDIAQVASRLLDSLQATATPKNREEEAAKAKARSAQRFGTG